MIEIKKVRLGLPAKDGVNLLVRVLAFDTNAIDVSIYYEVLCEQGSVLANGNLTLSENEWNKGITTNEEIEDMVLLKLGLEKI